MSKQLELPPHGNTRYPWALWMDGQVHKVKHGRHFSINPKTFQRSLSVRAARCGVKVESRVSKDGVVSFQFSKPVKGKA